MRKALLVLVPLLLGSGPSGATLIGHVTFTRNGKEVPYDDGYVYLQTKPVRSHPKDDLGGSAVKTQIVQQGKKFVPAAIMVPLGATVAFPNADREEHNVFSPDRPNFDLGRYNTDAKGKTHVFEFVDEINIYCDIHRDMAASVKVVATRPEWIVKVTGGAFALGGIPDGHYRLGAWAPHIGTDVFVDVVVANGQVTATPSLDQIHVALQEPPAHRRKDGTPYPCPYPPCQGN